MTVVDNWGVFKVEKKSEVQEHSRNESTSDFIFPSAIFLASGGVML